MTTKIEQDRIGSSFLSSLDGWIVTTGYKVGVTNLVGEAIRDHKVTNPRSEITAIGCSKWGATKNRDALITVRRSLRSLVTSDIFLVERHNESNSESESGSNDKPVQTREEKSTGIRTQPYTFPLTRRWNLLQLRYGRLSIAIRSRSVSPSMQPRCGCRSTRW